ncbi:coil containing protein [Vibrio phage 1.121.O._10N.286.46.C4]|nr:coil containing protein [Vibrio phage 1.121.O._10N.286.46.C4]
MLGKNVINLGGDMLGDMLGDYQKATEFAKWVCVQPIAGHTGAGIIVDVVDTHPTLVEMGYSKESYTVQTDFGNTFKMTLEEMKSMYKPTNIEKDPLARMERQQELLREALETYYLEV